MRKVLLGVAALLVSGSLATAGEELGLKLDVGLDVGVVQSVELADGDIDGSSMALVPSLAATYSFTEEWSATLWLRYLAGFEDDEADTPGGDAELQISGFDIGGLAGYTFKLSDEFTLVPVAGLSYRMWTVEIESTDYECSLLALDLGAKAAYKLNDQFSITGGLMLGLGVSGSAEVESEDSDLDGIALILEIKGGVAYKLTDMISLNGGLAYEMLSVSWEPDGGDSYDDDLSRFSVQLGATFKF